MATYTFLQNEPTVFTYGTEVVQPAERWTWVTSPSGIAYSLVFHPIPPPQGGPSIWTGEAINQQAQEWADILETVMGYWNVTGVYQAQELDASNALHDFIFVVVRSTSGLSSRTIQVRQEALLPPSDIANEVNTITATLDNIEAGASG